MNQPGRLHRAGWLPSDRSWSGLGLRLLIIASFFIIWWVVYAMLNDRAVRSGRLHRFEPPYRGFPWIIQPWTAYLYLLGGLLMPLGPFAIGRTWARMGLILSVYTAWSVVAFSVYLAYPVGMARPSFPGDSPGEWIMRAVFLVDEEANCLPSSHAGFAVMAALLIGHEPGASRRSRAIVWVLAAAICATTVTTGQHYFLDMIAGGGLGWASFEAARGFLGRRAAPHRI